MLLFMRLYNKLKEKQDHVFLIPCLILSAYLVFRIFDRSAIIWYFPLDYANDLSSHIAKLFFLAKYGFHASVPNWYAGLDYVSFRSYPPGWYFLTLPLYIVFNNAQVATYVSLILIYLSSLIASLIIGKRLGFSWLRSLTYFLLFYANPVAIGYLLRVGRMPELTGWLFAFIAFGFLFYYKDRPFNWKFGLLSLVLGAWLITNTTSFLATSPLFIGFFFAKDKKFKLAMILSGLIAFILSSFWLIPYLTRALTFGGILQKPFTIWLLAPGLWVDKITTWISSLFVLIAFLFYWKQKNKSKNELIFFGPILLIAFLLFTRLIIFVPLYKFVFPDTYNLALLLVGIYLFLSIKFSKLKLLSLALIILVGLGVIFSLLYTKLEVPHTQKDKDTLELMQQTDEILLIIGNKDSFSRAFYSYGAIYYDTKTISGWFDQDIDPELLKVSLNMTFPTSIKQCPQFLEYMDKFNIGAIITYEDSAKFDIKILDDYGNFCKIMGQCGLKEISKLNNVCLYER